MLARPVIECYVCPVLPEPRRVARNAGAAIGPKAGPTGDHLIRECRDADATDRGSSGDELRRTLRREELGGEIFTSRRLRLGAFKKEVVQCTVKP